MPWVIAAIFAAAAISAFIAVYIVYRRAAAIFQQLQEATAQATHIKRDYEGALSAYRQLEGERDKVLARVSALEGEVQRLEGERDTSARELDRIKREMIERPKLKTQIYKIVVIGMRSTGKTSLILKWANPTWEVRNPPGATLFNKFSRTVSSVHNARSGVVVNHLFEIFDFGGERLVEAQETLVVDDIHGLLLVVDLGQEGAETVDEARVAQQINAFSAEALQFFLRAPRIVKSCQTVVLFINKSDLLSGTPAQVEQAARAKFARLIEALQGFSEQVQLEIMVGSSYSGHNTHRLMPHFIQQLLPDDAYDEQLQQRAQGRD